MSKHVAEDLSTENHYREHYWNARRLELATDTPQKKDRCWESANYYRDQLIVLGKGIHQAGKHRA